jgi:hypothetical protein
LRRVSLGGFSGIRSGLRRALEIAMSRFLEECVRVVSGLLSECSVEWVGEARFFGRFLLRFLVRFFISLLDSNRLAGESEAEPFGDPEDTLSSW